MKITMVAFIEFFRDFWMISLIDSVRFFWGGMVSKKHGQLGKPFKIWDVSEAVQNIHFFYDALIGLAYQFSFTRLIDKTWHVLS